MSYRYLQHVGVIGMHWGQRRGASKSSISRRKSSAKQVDPDAHLSPEEKAAKKQKEIEATKAAVLKSRSPKELYKHIDLFTDKEVQDALNRLTNESKISELANKQRTDGQKRVEKIIKTLNTVGALTESGIKAYSGAAKIYNAFAATDGKQLPLIKG